jgi:MFS family permease
MGLVLGGIVSDLISVLAAFAAAAAFAFIASPLAYLSVPETHVETDESGFSSWEIDTRLPTLTIGMMNFGLFFTYLGAFFATLVLFIDEEGYGVWGYGPQGMSGLLMAVTVIAASVFTLGGGKISDKFGTRTPTLIAFLGISFVGFVWMAFSSSLAGLVGASLCIGAGQGGMSGPLIALLADLTPDKRMGRAMATNNILGDLGGGFGPIVALPVVDAVGFSPVYMACALVPLLAGICLVGSLYSYTGEVNPRTAAVTDD